MSIQVDRGTSGYICKACGYNERVGYVTLCPLHAAAEEMRDLLASMCRAQDRISGNNPLDALLDEARALLAKVTA